MNYATIADIYSANEKFRDRLTSTLNGISDAEATTMPEGEKWSIQQIVEHLSMVDEGISRICSKLLTSAKAAARPADGTFKLSDNFAKRAAEIAALRLEAPDRVQPTGNVTIADAMNSIAGNRQVFESLRSDFEKFELAGHTFPHPFFGGLDAGEWLVMAGLHQNRHTKQIERLLERVRQ
jgi:hypothetical protein